MFTPTFSTLKQSNTKDMQYLTTKEKCLTKKSDLSSPVPAENGQNVSPSVTEKITLKQRKNRKRKRQQQSSVNSSINSDKSSSIDPAIKEKQDESSESLKPTKKKRKKKKKKSAEQQENSTGTGTSEYKTVVIVKSPEDYSANWKQLKEVFVNILFYFIIYCCSYLIVIESYPASIDIATTYQYRKEISTSGVSRLTISSRIASKLLCPSLLC